MKNSYVFGRPCLPVERRASTHLNQFNITMMQLFPQLKLKAALENFKESQRAAYERLFLKA